MQTCRRRACKVPQFPCRWWFTHLLNSTIQHKSIIASAAKKKKIVKLSMFQPWNSHFWENDFIKKWLVRAQVKIFASCRGSLSLRHGASFGCGWRNDIQYGGWQQKYWIRSHGQVKRDGPPVWSFGEVLTTPQLKSWPCYETYTCASGLEWYFRTSYAMEKGHEIWYMKCMEPVWVRFTTAVNELARYSIN